MCVVVPVCVGLVFVASVDGRWFCAGPTAASHTKCVTKNDMVQRAPDKDDVQERANRPFWNWLQHRQERFGLMC
jgi:hypothetical protein